MAFPPSQGNCKLKELYARHNVSGILGQSTCKMKSLQRSPLYDSPHLPREALHSSDSHLFHQEGPSSNHPGQISTHFQKVPTHRGDSWIHPLLLPIIHIRKSESLSAMKPWGVEDSAAIAITVQAGKLSGRAGLWCGLKGTSRRGAILPARSSVPCELQIHPLLS